MDDSFLKDDKTRIGGFNNSPPADNKPPPVWQSVPPDEGFKAGAPPLPPDPFQPPPTAAPSSSPVWQSASPDEGFKPSAPPLTPDPFQPPPTAASSSPPVWQSAPPDPGFKPSAPPVSPEPYRPPPQPVAASPAWQSAPSREPFPPAPAPAAPESQRPPQPQQDMYRLSSQQDDMWFVVDLPRNPIRYPMRQGETVTLGREASQNIVIEDKTLSRNHLVMRRNGDRIAVQVLGLNGLVFANQIYKSTSLEIPVPASITIGNVSCKLERKFDSDATILMNDPASASRQRPGAGGAGSAGSFAGGQEPPSSFSPSSGQSWGGGNNHPFSPVPGSEKSSFGGNQPIPPSFPSAGQSPVMPPPSYAPPSFEVGGNENAGGGMPYGSSAYDQRGGQEKKKLLMVLGGGIGLAVLVLGIGLYLWLKKPEQVNPPSGSASSTVAGPSTATPVTPAVPVTQPAASGCAAGQGTNNLYAKYLNKAKTFLQEGNKKDACDYLKDIPQSSACWPEAVELSKQIDDCKIE